MNSTRVLALLPLFLGLAHSFSWDIVVGEEKQLQFYHSGTLTHTEEIPSAHWITSVTYDPVHYSVLFTDESKWNMSISSFFLSTRKIQPLVTRERESKSQTLCLARKHCNTARVVYDPVTQLMFWMDIVKIYSRSVKPASSNEAVGGNLILELDFPIGDIAVDSCGGYIYWTTPFEIERVRFDGSERKRLLDSTVYSRQSIAIDQQTQTIYWADIIYEYDEYFYLNIRYGDLNNTETWGGQFYTDYNETNANSLAISKDFIYWRGFHQSGIWQLAKSRQYSNGDAKLYSIFNQDSATSRQVIATNYSIKEQTQGIQNCEVLKNVGLLCVHGTEVSGESRCECAQGYTGERCDVSLCHNYCLQGDCSISAEGQPNCRCKAGYSGERCEVNACHKHCLNNGACSLNEEEPVCKCTADYEGERCDIATTYTGVHSDNMTQQILQDLRSEVKQVREDLRYSLQHYTDQLDENAKAQIQICMVSMKDD